MTPLSLSEARFAPDSELARKAAVLAWQGHSGPLLNHVHSKWWFAEFTRKRRQMKYDRELVYIASLLHGLGLSEDHAADKRSEVDGADAASRFLHAHDYPETTIGIVWDAIALHSAADSRSQGAGSRARPLRRSCRRHGAQDGRDFSPTHRR
ncbi:hypothetical protein [Paraburkholderia sp. BR14320]|uniref:hypothetical protein n=1 Tax=unclassified Paraburkholderia TaxID=2615204 RepID=UPI0034CDEA7A